MKIEYWVYKWNGNDWVFFTTEEDEEKAQAFIAEEIRMSEIRSYWKLERVFTEV